MYGSGASLAHTGRNARRAEIWGNGMEAKEWRIGRAAFIGAFVGTIYSFVRPALFPDNPLPTNQAQLIGEIVGSALGGCFLFAVAAAVRNSLSRRSR